MNYAALKKKQRHYLKAKLIEHMGSLCVRCELEHPLECFDFHHINPTTKSFEINQDWLVRKSWEEILYESDKTVLVCSNCHRSIHANNEEAYFDNTYLRHRDRQFDPDADQDSLFKYWD